MRRFTWTQRYTIRIPELDTEHQDIFKLAAEMERAVLSGEDPPRAHALLRRILEHSRMHFAREERLMRASGYPAYRWHKGQHDAACKKLLALEPRVRAGDTGAALHLLDIFAPWLDQHIRVSDRMMGAYLGNYHRARAVAKAS